MKLKDLQTRQAPSKVKTIRESLFDHYKSEGEYRQDIEQLNSQAEIKKQGLESLEERIFNSELMLFNLENWVDLENDLVEDLDKQIKDNEKHITQLEKRIPDLEKEAQEKGSALKIVLANKKVKASTDRFNFLEEKYKEVSDAMAEMEGRQNQIANDIISKENQIDSLNKQEAQKVSTVKSYDAHIKDRQVSIQNLNGEIEQKTKELVPINELVDEINNKRNRIGHLEQSLQIKTSELKNVQTDYKDTIKANDLLTKKNEEADVELSGLRSKILSNKSQLEDWENKIRDCQVTCSDLITQISEYDATKQNIDKEIQAAKRKLRIE